MWPGRAWPLGATWGEESTNFAVYAPNATALWVCLFADPEGDKDGVETRHELTEQTLGIWHGALPGIVRGQRYGFRADGPWDPDAGLRFNPAKLLLDPYALAVSGTFTSEPPVFGHVRGDDGSDQPHVRDERDSAA
ncbi:MAG: glgX 2, partial [Marmoricola sp.]|nr:glgX 2 [Marmoricola sp.]